MAPVLRSVTLASEIDLAGFRRACRVLVAEGTAPENIAWHTPGTAPASLVADASRTNPALEAGRASDAPAVPVPAGFMTLCEGAILHRDPGRFGLLYRLLWRLRKEPALRHDALDADRVEAERLAQAVQRDMETMKTGVRFRPIEAPDPRAASNDRALPGPRHIGWFEPEHRIVEAVAPFFARRYAHLRWALLTPERSARWDGTRLEFGPGGQREDALPAEAGAHAGITSEFEHPRSLADLGQALERCRACPLGAHATQAVPGAGPARARLMFVGEQPGDQEDLRGRPFVGPAGQLLDRAFRQLGWSRDTAYVTNAVKHFKFELRGQRRIHKTPDQQEAAACLHWLESEIELVQPEALVALGATAARQLTGTPVAVLRQRGQWLRRGDGRRVLITLHPSALLRTDPPQREAAYAAWLADLRQADAYFR